MAGWMPDVCEDTFDQLERIEAEAQAKGRSLLQHAIISVLEQSTVVSTILEVKRIE